MARFRNICIAVSALGILAVVITASPMGSAAAQGMKPMLVQIVGSDEPIPTTEGAREPLALGQRLLGLNQEHETLVTVPEGKQLVIELVTVAIGLPPHLRPSANINVTSNGQTSQHQIAVYPVATADGIVSYHGTHAVRLYADPGTDVKFFTGFRPDDPEWDNRVTGVSLSGYLVDAPPED